MPTPSPFNADNSIINLLDSIESNLQSFTYGGNIYNTAGFTIGGPDSNANMKIVQILGTGMFTIVAIPEPSTWLLLSVGAVTLLALRRRRR
ncbi:MAG: PEP-CTERM sorting domain-containing protein [Verrucomicrobiales bacterium]|jgi:hypothetical protein|nr:PEP-CTERM sorting domain-containing protein [Verrucomicrobiales bacterium]